MVRRSWAAAARSACLAACAAAPLATAPAVAADDHGKAVMSPEKADADFKFQGEYAGVVVHDGDEEAKYGVQVIARGNGKFDAVGYPGGLPGAGWNGEDKVAGSGERHDDKVVVKNAEMNAEATIYNNRMTLTVEGKKVGELDRVERESPTRGEAPPSGAVVLFSGKPEDVENFKPGAKIENGYLTPGFTSKQEFGDQRLHLEFMLSYMPEARGQGRSNSGCYLQGRYEVQILDSFGLKGENNECGGIYQAAAPKLNMCFPPLVWQTYDIDFTAAKYEGGRKTAPARMTVKQNGIVIHDDVEVPGGTPGGTQGEGAGPGPLFVQNHGNPLYFRNIWVVKK